MPVSRRNRFASEPATAKGQSVPSASASRIWLFLLKLTISIGLVGWIIQDVDFGDIGEIFAQADVDLLVLAFSLFFIGYFLTAVRWRLLMSTHGLKPPLLVLVQSFMVGIFFNNILPSTIGGDLSRMYDAWRIARDKTMAVSVVLVDRFLGVLALILWAVLAVLISQEIRALPAVYVPVIIVFVLATVLVAILFGRPRDSVDKANAWLRRVLERGPAYIARSVIKVLDAVDPYYQHNKVLLRALSVSLVLQFNVIIHFWLIARALDMEISILAMCVVIPCSLMIMMLPISVNAIGVREVTFVYFLSLFGISGEKALVFAWIAFVFVLLQGLLGGVVFALRRKPPDLSGRAQQP